MTLCIFVVEGWFFLYLYIFFLVDLGFYIFGGILLENVVGEKKKYNTSHDAVIMW